MRALVLSGVILVLSWWAPAPLVAELGSLPRAANVPPDASTQGISGSDFGNHQPSGHGRCEYGDRGRLLDVVRVASYPTPSDAQAYYDAWIEFYVGFYVFPPLPNVDINYGFDTYKVTYCTID